METKAPFTMNEAARRTQADLLRRGAIAHRAALFAGLYDRKFAPGATLKRLRDMNGAEVCMVATAMNTLCTMQTEARALMRVSEAVGPDRVVSKVMKRDEFLAFCSAAPAAA